MPESDLKDYKATVNKALDLALKALGYERSKKSWAAESLNNRANWGQIYQRRRELFRDEIQIQWAQYERKRFIINFWTDQPGRMEKPGWKPFRGFYQHIQRRSPGGWREWFGGDPWFGARGGLQKTLDVAQIRLNELDRYLVDGVWSPCIVLINFPGLEALKAERAPKA
jgi:hypothetical protein